MRGEWKGLQALFLDNCPSAYYVHYFAYRLQLTLVTASQGVVSIYELFSNLNFIFNVAGSSCKRHGELQDAQEGNITHLMVIDELETIK
jgi:hypothetical protein